MWYFVPRQGPARELVEAAGLEYAFAGVPGVETTIVSGDVGPDGLAGTVLSVDPAMPKVVWRKREYPPRAGLSLGVWLGWNAANPPGPVGFARPGVATVGWAKILLADGKEWAVPLALPCTEREAGRASQLPSVARSATEFEPRRDYDQLRFDLSLALERELTPGEVIEMAAALLAVGYRVSLAEVLALELLTPENAYACVAAAIDFHERIAARSLRADPDAVTLVERLATEQRVDEGTAGRVAAALATKQAAPKRKSGNE